MQKEISKTIDQYEGGLLDHPLDPGGETKYGISKHIYPDIDIEKLTHDEAVEIARVDYWEKLHCSEINSIRVRWKLFDLGFNCGIITAAKMLQRASKVGDDGIIGPVTLGAVNRIVLSTLGEHTLLHNLAEQQVNHYVSIAVNNPTQIVFLRGWVKRAFDLGTGLI